MSTPSATYTFRTCSWMKFAHGFAAPPMCSGWPSIPAPSFFLCLSSAPEHNIWPTSSSTRCDRCWPPFCLPIFTSDGLNLYFYALTAHFGQWLELVCRRRKVRQWQVAAGLIYGQVKKSYRRRKLTRVTPVMRLGTEADLTVALQKIALSGRLNTAFIERVNLTVRHGIAALARRTWATAQQSPHLVAHLEWWRAYYHGCRVLTNHSEWRSCSRASEVAGVWRNATDRARPPWQPAEPTDDGRLARCSLAPCRRFPLERHVSLMWEKCHIARNLEKVPVEALRWSLASGRGGLSGLSTDEKTSPKWVCRG
jgi:IS1 family transposase